MSLRIFSASANCAALLRVLRHSDFCAKSFRDERGKGALERGRCPQPLRLIIRAKAHTTACIMAMKLGRDDASSSPRFASASIPILTPPPLVIGFLIR